MKKSILIILFTSTSSINAAGADPTDSWDRVKPLQDQALTTIVKSVVTRKAWDEIGDTLTGITIPRQKEQKMLRLPLDQEFKFLSAMGRRIAHAIQNNTIFKEDCSLNDFRDIASSQSLTPEQISFLCAHIIRQHQLITWQDIKDEFIDIARGQINREEYLDHLYHFSVQELLDQDKIDHQKRISQIGIGFHSDLTTLYLVDKCIESLEGLLDIYDIQAVEILVLSQNKIRAITDRSFQRLSALTSLNLTFNKIKDIKKDAFKDLISLRHLLLDHNALEHIAPETLQPLTALRSLKLNDNPGFNTEPEQNAIRTQLPTNCRVEF